MLSVFYILLIQLHFLLIKSNFLETKTHGHEYSINDSHLKTITSEVGFVTKVLKNSMILLRHSFFY